MKTMLWKHPFILAAVCVVIFSGAFAACSFLGDRSEGNTATIEEPPSGPVIARVKDGSPRPVITDSALRKLFAEDFDLSVSPGKYQQGIRLEKVSFDGTRYLIGEGKDAEGNCVVVALGLAVSGGAVFLRPDKHKCTGVGCASCAFVRNNNNEITGCDCTNPVLPNGHCNHTIESGD